MSVQFLKKLSREQFLYHFVCLFEHFTIYTFKQYFYISTQKYRKYLNYPISMNHFEHNN